MPGVFDDDNNEIIGTVDSNDEIFEGEDVIVTGETDGGEVFQTEAPTPGIEGPIGPQGPAGDPGELGPKGDRGENGIPFLFTDLTQTQLDQLKGEDGQDGAGASQELINEVNVNSTKVSSPTWVPASNPNYLTAHQSLSGKQSTITDLTTIRSGAALGGTSLQSFTETNKVVSGDSTYVDGINAVANAAQTSSEVTAAITSSIAGKVDTVSGEGLIKTPPTIDGAYTYTVEDGEATWETGSSGGGSYTPFAFKTIDDKLNIRKYVDGDTVDPAVIEADGWILFDGFSTDIFSLNADTKIIRSS